MLAFTWWLCELCQFCISPWCSKSWVGDSCMTKRLFGLSFFLSSKPISYPLSRPCTWRQHWRPWGGPPRAKTLRTPTWRSRRRPRAWERLLVRPHPLAVSSREALVEESKKGYTCKQTTRVVSSLLPPPMNMLVHQDSLPSAWRWDWTLWICVSDTIQLSWV
jgi:hypothetical protein